MKDSTSNPARRSGANRAVAAGLTLGVIGGTAAGLVFGVPGLTSAASGPVQPAGVAAIVQQVGEDDPVATQDGAPVEVGDRLRETLQSLVDDGTITEGQADAVTAHLVENRPERGERGERGEGHPGDHRGGPGSFARGEASEALTDLLDIETQDLRQRLRDGATLAEIAEDQGVEAQEVVDLLVGELAERLDNAVENGRLDQADADEKLAEAEERIADMVDNGRPERGGTDTDD